MTDQTSEQERRERVFQPGEGPWWGLTPQGRQAARLILALAILTIFAAGCSVGVGIGHILPR